MRRLFVFRPEPAAQQTLAKIRALGLEAVSVPLFELQKLDWSPPPASDYDALLLTSANTLNMAGKGLDLYRALAVHAVGEGTAVAARVAGLGVATIGSGGVDHLLQQIDPALRLLHLCGEDRRGPSLEGRSITHVPVYRAAEKAQVVGLEDLAGQAAVLHSPRAARRLAELVARPERSTIRIACISAATAEAAGAGWENVAIATCPKDEELLALASRLCET